MDGNILEKLKILSDSAKYDVSCSTSGVERKNVGRMGNASCSGICHSWSADGRCISLLKVLFTNDCVYDCKYCVNRRSADTPRASFEPFELAELVMEFYRRNYIEGLFLSSAVERSPDDTAERIFKALYLLREEYMFAGYIHAKIIPGVSPEILHRIGMVADRLSVNIELPSEDSLKLLAPQKKASGIFKPMRQITQTLAEQRTLKGPGFMDWLTPSERSGYAAKTIADGKADGAKDALSVSSGSIAAAGANALAGDGSLAEMTHGGLLAGRAPDALAPPDRRRKYKEKFAPAGQSTQMIIGASPESDKQIIRTSETLYRTFKLKRVYFSAYIPIADSPFLPALLTPPPLRREHRLYQADWLLRFYGFGADEILDDANPFLDPDLDPKTVWALRHLEDFPIEVNKASLEELLRVPGIGNTSAMRIVRQRRLAAVKYDDLKKMGTVLKRARFFITCSGKYYGGKLPEPEYIKGQVLEETSIRNLLLERDEAAQISMFETMQGQLSGSPAAQLPHIVTVQ